MNKQFFFKKTNEGIHILLNEIKSNIFRKKTVKIDYKDWKNFSDIRYLEALSLLKNELENETNRVKVLDDGSGLFISHDIVSSLNAVQAEILGLPPTFPYNFSIKTQDNIMSKNLQIYWELIDKGRSIGFERTGAVITVGEKSYRLSDPYYKIAEHLDKFPNPNKVSSEKILEFIADLKSLIPEEIRENFEIDGHLNDIDLKHAHGFSIQITGNMNTLNFNPILFGKDIKDKIDENGEIVEEDEQLLPDEIARKFTGQFKKDKDVKKTYLLANGKYVFLEPNLRKVLTAVQKISKSDIEIRKKFLKNPKSIIRGLLEEEYSTTNSQDTEINLIELENIFIETSQFSQRVIGLGLWEKMKLAYLKKEPQDWFDDIFRFLTGGEIIMVPKDKVEECIKVIENSLLEGKHKTNFPGCGMVNHPPHKTFEITKELLDELKQRVKAKPKKEPKDGSDGNEPKEKKDQFVILTKENFEEVEYSVHLKKRSKLINDTNPKNLDRSITLYKHQKECIRWLASAYNKGLSGVLMADDMGLGKTLQALSFLSILRENIQQENAPFLIVAPVGLLKNWEVEHNKHLNEPGLGKLLKVYGLDLRNLRSFKGKDIDIGMPVLNTNKIKSAEWVLTTYETLRDYQASFAQIKFSCVIFDEMQKVKNPSSQITSGAKAVNSNFIIGLTGTPVENTMSDLWQIMDIIIPGYLGELKTFVYNYPDDDIEQLKKLAIKLTKPKDYIGIPLVLRRLKKDVISKRLPKKKIVEILETTEMMPELQENHYNEIISQKNIGQFSSLKALQNMRQSSLIPYEPSQASTYGTEKFINSSARLKVLFRELDKIHKKKEKVLIFLERRDLQPLLCEIIQEKYNLENRPLIINGEISGDTRQKRVELFQKSEEDTFNTMIISPKAGGVGITLTAANNIIHLERWWNPAVEDQCTDRAYRIGQKKDVSVFIPIARSQRQGENSFDLILNKILTDKRKTADGVFMPTNINAGDGWGFSGAFGDDKKSKISLEDIDAMEGIPFEDFIHQKVNLLPNLLCQRTKLSWDGGADLIVEYEIKNKIAIIQCKHRSSKETTVSESVIEKELLNAKKVYDYKNPILILVSNVTKVTKGCEDMAKKQGVVLLLRNKLENFEKEIMKIMNK